IWAIFYKGKYYNLTEFWKTGTGTGASVINYDPDPNKPIPMIKGVDSKIWAGDYFDIVYISVKDYVARQDDFSSTPLVTVSEYKMNTAWDLTTLGDHLYYPDTQSIFLGEVGFGEKILLKLKLDNTRLLNPNFGLPYASGAYQYYQDFAYNYIQSNDKYVSAEAADFEISLGFGGKRSDWIHIVKDLSPTDPKKIKDCGSTENFSTQIYTRCIQLPTDSDIV
ncbi:hypothetical protein CH371_20335, partial [Leptospira wolffii]